MFRRVLLTTLLCAAAPLAAGETPVVRLATTTSTAETGLLDALLPPFEKAAGLKVHVIAVGSGKALKLGEAGDVDLLLVHSPEAEKAFVAAGHGVHPREVMYNDFVVLGPADDPAGVKGSKTAVEALGRIAAKKAVFVSRGDDSGTDAKDKALWTAAGFTLAKRGAWYVEAGQGMSLTLRMADEKRGYVLADRATWLKLRKTLSLAVLHEGDAALRNTYRVIALSPAKHPHVEQAAAKKLAAWLVSPGGRAIIDRFQVDGETLFHSLP